MRTYRLPICVMLVWLASGVAIGQDRTRQRNQVEQPGRRERLGGEQGTPKAGRSAWGGLNPFRPSPADRGPLREGETDEVLEFARKEMPRAYSLLMAVRERNPQAFERQLERLAPRVRHLRRVFEQDADLGRIVIEHSENLLTLRRIREEWRRASGRPQARERLRGLARRLLAANLRLEARALERWITIREERHDQDIDQRLQQLSGADALDWSGESKPVRQKLNALQSAVGPEHEKLFAELRALLTRQEDGEVSRLRERLARLRRDAVPEVDRRLSEFIESANKAGPQPRPQREKRKRAGSAERSSGRSSTPRP